MREYDETLKVLFQRSADMIMQALTGSVMQGWMNIEIPKMPFLRVDLLGRTFAGQLVHIEFQSTNDSMMVVRMAEYGLGVYRLTGEYPLQIVLYVGNPPMRMKTELEGPGMRFAYKAVDIRSMDGESLLASPEIGDNILAVLTGLPNVTEVVREVLAKIAALEGSERELALGHLLALSGLRELEQLVEEEIKQMPILDDIMDHKVLGREFKRGLAEGIEIGRKQWLEQGMEQGIEKGIEQGELKILRRLIKKRFKTVPDWVESRLKSASPSELEALGESLLDANSLEELLP